MNANSITHREPSIWCGRLLLALLLGSLSGCGGNPQGRLPLEGTVNHKGKPLPHGSIQFDAAESQNAAFLTGATIENGRFVVPGKVGLPPGKYFARISAQSAPFITPGRPPGSLPETKELIPDAYNSQSKEIIEMKQHGDNTFEFNIP
jgi:hypothetical protein